MDWNNVSLSELWEGLREVDWRAPRPVSEFVLQRGCFILPTSTGKFTSRLKNNAYYYRTNYALLFAAGSACLLLRRPPALAALALICFALMCLNDPFATATNEHLLRIVKKVHSRTALKLRALVGNNDSTLGPRRRGYQRLFILWLPRNLLVVLGVLIGALLMWRSTPPWTIAYSFALGIGLPLIHATFRTPNLKARLASAKEEFRAVWRGYQAGLVNDYTQ